MIVVAAVLIYVFSQGDSLHDLRAFLQRIKHKEITVNKNSVTNSVNSLIQSVYVASKQRTPFESKVVVNSIVKAEHPINAYPLSQLRFLGTIEANQQISGVIMTPDTKIYQVKEGDTIGDRYGRIKTIYPDRLEIEEQVSEPGSAPTQRIVTLQLKDQS